MKIYLWSLFLLIALFWNSFDGNSQEVKLSRQERKEVRKAQLLANFNILDSLLNAKSFVLEADYLQDRYGYRVPVVSNLNFIKVNVTRGILQTGSDFRTGYNGVGGVTAEGSMGKWQVMKNFKNLSYTIRFNLMTQIGQFDIFLTVNADNNASSTISGLGPGKLTWVGHLETVDNSRVFKGQDTI